MTTCHKDRQVEKNEGAHSEERLNDLEGFLVTGKSMKWS